MKPVDQPRRQARDLLPAELERLNAAHARLREAVRQYDRFQGRELRGSGESTAGGLREISKAQEEVRAAEDHLWRIRDELLGWPRPEWAPRAATISDWFSEEDQDYDHIDVSAP